MYLAPMMWNSNFFVTFESMKLLCVPTNVSLPDFKFGPGAYAIAGHQTCSDAPQPSHRHSDLPPVSTMVFTKVHRCAIARALRLGQRSETPRHN